jgi:glycosyltransferase involved in cell wall biosynthesis
MHSKRDIDNLKDNLTEKVEPEANFSDLASEIDGMPSSRRRNQLISVIIPTRNRPAKAAQALSILLENEHLPLEIIFVDQSSSENSRRTVEAIKKVLFREEFSFSIDDKLSDVRYIHCNGTGAGLSRNTGAEAARGEIILFMDDDCIPSFDWVKIIEEEYQQHPDICGVYGRILPLSLLKKNYRTGIEPARISTERRVYRKPLAPWKIGSGANMSFRRKAFLKAGGFDEVLTIGGPFEAFEDLDIAYRLLLQGAPIVYNGKALVYHDSSKNFEEQLATEKGYGKGCGAAVIKYLRCGHYKAISLLLLWYLLPYRKRVLEGGGD